MIFSNCSLLITQMLFFHQLGQLGLIDPILSKKSGNGDITTHYYMQLPTIFFYLLKIAYDAYSTQFY